MKIAPASAILNEDANSNSNDSNSLGSDKFAFVQKSTLSLLDQHNELKKKATAQKESEREKQLKEEEKILASIAETKALLSFTEIAKGIQYVNPIKTNWTVPRCISSLPNERHEEIRRLTGISIEGEDVPPPIASFKVTHLNRIYLFNLD